MRHDRRGYGALPPAFFLALAFTIIWPAAAQAKTITLDDSGTQALEPAVSMRWKSAAPSRSARRQSDDRHDHHPRAHQCHALAASHSGRIYLSCRRSSRDPISVSWTTQGRFLPGQLQSGNRVLVYAGPITTPFMEDVLTFQFSVDGALMRRTVPVTFHFEMDED